MSCFFSSQQQKVCLCFVSLRPARSHPAIATTPTAAGSQRQLPADQLPQLIQGKRCIAEQQVIDAGCHDHARLMIEGMMIEPVSYLKLVAVSHRESGEQGCRLRITSIFSNRSGNWRQACQTSWSSTATRVAQHITQTGQQPDRP